MDGNKLDLLKEISEQEFICMELNLYLDTHPQDQRAIGDYSRHCAELRILKDRFADEFGPMENFGNADSKNTWGWNNSWPWESE